MKNVLTSLFMILVSLNVFSHDEGHGPKLTESSNLGGVMASVVDAKDAAKGDKASLVYKAELVRSESGQIRIYLYDDHMHRIDLKKFDKNSEGVALSIKKKKSSNVSLTFNSEDNAFVGNLPKVESRPFNLEIKLKEGSRELLTNFQNLD